MMIRKKFTDPQLNRTLELFSEEIEHFYGNHLVAIVLYGSVIFDDLAPGYGDLDFLIVIEGDLLAENCQGLTRLRQPLRRGDGGIYAQMLEGAFLPRQMLDPAVSGNAYWWGTRGERFWRENRLGWISLKLIREMGIMIWGTDIRGEIPEASQECLLEEIKTFCQSLKEHGKGGCLHSVDWLLMAARALLFLKEGQMCSKSDSADWGFSHATGEWRKFLPRASQLRLNPQLAEAAEWQQWLAGLGGPIQEAGKEIMLCLKPIMRSAPF
jgi:hypothetical protein